MTTCPGHSSATDARAAKGAARGLRLAVATALRAAVAGVPGLVLGGAWVVAAGEAAEPEPPDFQRAVLPVLENHCFECHGDGVAKGGVTLDAFPSEDLALAAAPEFWRKVEQHVMLHVMPPPDAPAPTLAERRTLLEWIDGAALACDCSVPRPGKVTIRRLNRVEYDNTVRDLFGWPPGDTFRASAEFPPDDTGYGFDNVGDVLTFSPTLMDKYLRAAGQVLDRALVTALPGSATSVVPLESLAGGVMTGGLRMLTTNGRLTGDWPFAHRGEYEVRVTAFSHKAGNEEARVRLHLGEVLLGEYVVAGTRDEPSRLVRRFPLTAPGTHSLAIEFCNDWDDPDAEDPNRRDRNVLVTRIEVAGPFAPGAPELPASHRKVFGSEWIGHSPYRSQEARARDVIARFAGAAYRRPAQQRELDALQRLYWLADREGETFEGAVRVALEAVLASPGFLFRGEPLPAGGAGAGVAEIDPFSLASRLSYFLWSSMPDAALSEHAARGTLRASLDAEVARMLADPKARALTENFAGQWLQLRDIAMVKPDPQAFPGFDAGLRAAMREESERLFEAIVREDRSVLEFLTADYTFLNERLARHYGIPGVRGEAFRRVSLAGTARRGILSHASFLTLTSNPTRTSPVLRGKWILENILGTPPPPAPQVVPPIERPEVAQLEGSFRGRMQLHRRDSACAGCHFAMDTLGFAFEHFDGIGGWRDDDDGNPVETAGRLLTGEPFADARALVNILATDRRDDFLECFTERLLTYALGRGLQHTDRCAVKEILKSAAAADYRFSGFLTGVIHSVPFQMQEIRPAAAGGQESAPME